MSYCIDVEGKVYSLSTDKQEDVVKFLRTRPDIVSYMNGENQDVKYIVNDVSNEPIRLLSTLNVSDLSFESDLINAIAEEKHIFANQLSISSETTAKNISDIINNAFEDQMVSYEAISGRYQLQIDGVVDSDIYTTYPLTKDLIPEKNEEDDLIGERAEFIYEGFLKKGIKYKGFDYRIKSQDGLYYINSPFDGEPIFGDTQQDVLRELNNQIKSSMLRHGTMHESKTESIEDSMNSDNNVLFSKKEDVKNAIDYLVKDEEDLEKNIVERLYEMNPNMSIATTQDSTLQRYDHNTNTVIVNPKDEASSNAILHEMFHSTTFNAIENDKQFRDTIAYLINSINKRYSNKDKLKPFSSFLDLTDFNNGISNRVIHEFVTGALTDDKFNKLLRETPYVPGLASEKRRSLLSQLIDFLLDASNLSGLPKINIFANVIETMQYETNVDSISKEINESKEIDDEKIPSFEKELDSDYDDRAPFYTTTKAIGFANKLSSYINREDNEVGKNHLVRAFKNVAKTEVEDIAYGSFINPSKIKDKVAFAASFKRGDMINIPWVNWDKKDKKLYVDDKNKDKSRRAVINNVTYSKTSDRLTAEVLIPFKDGTIFSRWIPIGGSFPIKKDKSYISESIPSVNYMRRWVGISEDFDPNVLRNAAKEIRKDSKLFDDSKFIKVNRTYSSGKTYPVMVPKYGEYVTSRHWGDSKYKNLKLIKERDLIQISSKDKDGKSFSYTAPAVMATSTGVFVATNPKKKSGEDKVTNLKFIKSDDIRAIHYDLSTHTDILEMTENFNNIMNDVYSGNTGRGDVFKLAINEPDPVKRISLFENNKDDQGNPSPMVIPPRYDPNFDSTYLNGSFYTLDQETLNNRTASDSQVAKEGSREWTIVDNLKQRQYKASRLSMGDWIEVTVMLRDASNRLNPVKRTYPVVSVTENQVTYVYRTKAGSIMTGKANVNRSVDTNGDWFDLVKKGDSYSKKVVEKKPFTAIIDNIHVNNSDTGIIFDRINRKKDAIKSLWDNKEEDEKVTNTILDNHIGLMPNMNNLKKLQLGDYVKINVSWKKKDGSDVNYKEWVSVAGFRDDGTIEVAGLAKGKNGNYHYYKKPISADDIVSMGIDIENEQHKDYINYVYDEAKQVVSGKILKPSVEYTDIPSGQSGLFTARGIDTGEKTSYGKTKYRTAKENETSDKLVRVLRIVDNDTGEIKELVSDQFDYLGKKKINLDDATRTNKVKVLKKLKQGSVIKLKNLINNTLYVTNVESFDNGSVKVSYFDADSFDSDIPKIESHVFSKDKGFMLDNVKYVKMGYQYATDLQKKGEFKDLNKSKLFKGKSKANYNSVLIAINKFKKLYSDIEFKLYNNNEASSLGGLVGRDITDARAFETGGVIYINKDMASGSDVIHEMGHVFMPMVKLKDPVLYKQMMDGAVASEEYDYIKAAYPELNGNALNEEVFLTMFGEQYSGLEGKKYPEAETKHRRSLLSKFINFIKSLFNKSFELSKFKTDSIQDTKFANMTMDELINEFGDKMIKAKLNNKTLSATVSFSKNVLNLKKRLKEKGMIMEDCNE